MNDHDLTDVIELIPNAVRSTTVTGEWFDVSQYVGKGKVLLMASAATAGTTPTLNVKVQESDDASTPADVSGATFTEVTDAADLTEAIGLALDPRKKYIRVVGTIAGTDTPTFGLGVVLMARRQYEPAAQVVTA